MESRNSEAFCFYALSLGEGSEAARECEETIEYRFPSSVTEPQREDHLRRQMVDEVSARRNMESRNSEAFFMLSPRVEKVARHSRDG